MNISVEAKWYVALARSRSSLVDNIIIAIKLQPDNTFSQTAIE